MAITLAQAKELSQDKLTDEVIDEFSGSSLINDLTFDNTVKVQGGKTLAYVYNRITTQPVAGTRQINGEYTSQETATTQETVNLKVMGGSYDIDRVIQNDETQVVDQVEFQSKQKAKATIAVFHDLIINGDSAVDQTQFDGIDKVVTGSTTEIVPDTVIDLSSADAIKTNYQAFLYYIRKMIGAMDGAPHKLVMNDDMYTVFQTIADLVPNISFSRDELGNEIGHYGSATLEKIGDKAGTTTPIIPNDATNGTSLYAMRLGLDGLHGVSPDGTSLVATYPPDFKTSGAVKTGEVEIVGAIAVKATRSVAVLRKIKAA